MVRTEYCRRYIDDLNLRMGAYDLEATPNGVEGNLFAHIDYHSVIILLKRVKFSKIENSIIRWKRLYRKMV
jgi:hypothetical protein